MTWRRSAHLILLTTATLALFWITTHQPVTASRQAEPTLAISRITPVGTEVPLGRQIVVQFDRKVVPVGRMEREPSEIPVAISPELKCEWRWLDTAALACQLGEQDAFAPATRYRITVGPGLEAEDGTTLAEPYQHSFETERPKVTYHWFEEWRSPGFPRMGVGFNQRVTQESIRAHLHLLLPDGSRVPLRVERSARLQQMDRYWELEPERELPLDSAIQLRVEEGLVSLEGPLPSNKENTVVQFDTFPEHRFLGIACFDIAGHKLRIDAGAAADLNWLCNPLGGVSLEFSSPVIKEVLRDHLVVEPDLAGGREDYDPWEQIYSGSYLRSAHQKGRTYAVPLPEVLKARTEYRLKAIAAALRDEFGRALPADLDFVFGTDDRPPRLVLTHPVNTLEKNVGTHPPVVVTNIEEMELGLELRTLEGRQSRPETVRIPPAQNIAFRFPLAVREWLGGRSGALFANLSTPGIPRASWRMFSQVTPFAIHAKMGHQNTAVWVTDLETGKPVPGARVSLYHAFADQALEDQESLAEATTGVDGVALLAGNLTLNPTLAFRPASIDSTVRHHEMFFVRVQTDSDLGLLPLSWDYWIQPEAANDSWIPESTEPKFGHIRTWGTTAQGVYRAGDAIQYKLYVRDQDNERFVAAPAAGYTLRVYDPTDKIAHEVKELELNAFGAHDGEFKVAETAPVGWYRFELTSDFIERFWEPMRVLVADFTPSPFRVTTDLDGESFGPGDEMRVDTGAKLHAGGPYADAEARVTVLLRGTAVTSENPKARGFFFGSPESGEQTLHQAENGVNHEGELTSRFRIPDQGIVRGRLIVESAVRDDRGKYVAGRASAVYTGRDRIVGIRMEGWLLNAGEPAMVKALVLDPNDELAVGTPITVRAQYRETRAARVKGAGNAYLTQYEHEWVDVATCSLTSGADPVLCEFTPEKPGSYQIIASINDTEARAHQVNFWRWAQGRGQVLWETPPGHRLDIEPEKAEYKVGETARFLIRNPFPGAEALLTTERFGVQQHWTETFEESSQVVEVKVTEDHLPGFYFSAVVTSPRVEAPLGEGDVDLGKPAFRMGYVQVPVRDPAKEILVEVRPQQQAYKPRDRVTVDLTARPRNLDATTLEEMEGEIEVAVVVLDEAVFDLIGRGESYFDPYRGFYELEPLDVENFNLLTRLIGIQKFEKKGANDGGGGGGLDMRSVFKFVSYWNPSLMLDGEGRSRFEFEVPDNLTGWRVLAMAVSKEDRMGLGTGHFVVNQPTEIRPALPNQVTEGDQFEARFTVMNRSEETRVLEITAKVEGPADSPGIASLTLTADPYQRYPVSFPVRAVTDGEILFTVTAGDLVDGDALRLPLEVRKMTALEVAATYGTTVNPNTVESFLFPENMRTDVGRVSLVASPSVLGNIEGAFRYLRDYPYICWEQKLTKAVMASHFSELEAYVADDFTWPEHASIPETTLSLAANYQAPNGGMVYYRPENQYVSPYLSAYTALAFQWLRERGHSVPGSVETQLHRYLQDLLRRDVFPDFYSRGMSSTVRAVALAALAAGGSVDASDLERCRPHVDEMDLFGKAHFLMAATSLGLEATGVRDQILSHVNQSGGKLVFSEPTDTGVARILTSPERSQCAILSALSREMGGAPGGDGVGDIPFRLTRTITQGRKRRDRWENTQENVFCMNGLIDYSRVYESESPRYVLTSYFDEERIGRSEINDLRAEPVEHQRSLREADPGREGRLRISKLGPGRVYYAARLFYSPKELKRSAINSGIEIRREVSVERGGEWVLLSEPMRIRSGELVRVDLYVSLPSARNFVVVDDPVPGGLEPVNRDLSTASIVDAGKGDFRAADGAFWFTKDDWIWYGYSRWSFYHKELRHHAARFYSEYLPPGNYHLSYSAQAIAPGRFQVLPAHAEEMYDPDVFGQGLPNTLIVEEREQ